MVWLARKRVFYFATSITTSILLLWFSQIIVAWFIEPAVGSLSLWTVLGEFLSKSLSFLSCFLWCFYWFLLLPLIVAKNMIFCCK